jgi:exosortase F-associated protein
MLENLLHNKTRVVVLVLSIFGLVLVRAFEETLFYDPFLAFFKSDFQNSTLPIFATLPLFFGLVFRFSLNTIFSLAILYCFFKQTQMLLFASKLYMLALLILLLAFFAIVFLFESPNYVVLFYVRRFLIQPMLLMLFFPAFYLQYRSD